MAARRLLGATWSSAGWRVRELPDPAASVRLHVRDYATKRPVIKGGKGAVVGEALKDPEGVWGGGAAGKGAALQPRLCPLPIRLFQMNVGPPKNLEDLDPETREYWRLLRKHNIWRHNRLSKNQKF
ncbi:hypothetical protein EI555_003735 [Monodon monoceros]|uniref:Large ribosomal subunit protein mL54 n=1 Tax=Monodon monoceros TaxID=40151 RepID=A0A4U1F387_MONMO|nr:hypothetical protein EI555_003735 [Monodon monoceros]